MSSMPLIGIIASSKDVEDVSTPTTYTAAIEMAKGVPVVLPCGDRFDLYDCYVDLCDGFMFTGGCDIHPARYGEDRCAQFGYRI